MNDNELKQAFPFGAMVLPRAEGQFSFPAKVGDDYEEDPSFFTVWDTPDHGIELGRDLEPLNDGYVAKARYGSAKYFLRPLTEDQKVPFDA